MATIRLQEPTLQSRPSREDDTRQAGHIENPPRFSGEAQVAAHRRQSPRSSDPPSRHPLRPTDFVPQPPPCSLSVYQPSRRPRRRVLTQRFQWHLSMKRSSRRGGRAASQSRPSPAHRKEPYPTSLGDPKPNPTKPWGTSSTFMWRIVGFESCFGALAVPDRAAEFLHLW